ncbi:MAG TPA: NADP-dependent oxidoreductase [Steroidobacteraceae bacterium]|nr:NADP-dependent oxidoreductase [Steroidobacteraceae bacterium]
MSTNPEINRRVVLAARPRAQADLGCFRLEARPIAALREGELLLRTLWLSLDPYMRGRMSDAPSYAPPVAVGEVMIGGTVARVERSLNANFSVGELVLAASGWQEFEVSDGRGLTKLPAGLTSPSQALGILGMPGFTAYIGLLDIGKPRPEETVVVAAATGAVGSVVGQIAKLKGCRVVGIAGGAEKCAWAVRELGFDACVDHHSAALGEELAAACSRGIDVYYENVGGKVFRAVLPLLNAHARVPVCGLISLYDEAPRAVEADSAQALLRTILVKRTSVRGFIISDGFDHRRADFLDTMSHWLREGKIKYREDIVEGLENAPSAFLGLLAGRNFGKLIVRVGDLERARPGERAAQGAAG